MGNTTIDGKSLGDVQVIAVVKESNIIQFAFPGGDADVAETFDLLGATQVFTVTGRFTSGSVGELKTSIANISNIADGNQENSVNFVSDYTDTIKVKIGMWQYTWNVPGNNVDYSLKLLQGD